MESGTKISVVIPTRNRAHMLESAMESVLQQDGARDRFELIVVNDGSTDGTESVVTRLVDSHPDTVRYIPRPPTGLNASRNEGARAATGELVVFADDDIVAPPHWLAALEDGATRHPRVECFAGRILLQLEGRIPRTCGRESIGESELDLGDVERETDRAWGANFAVRRSALERVGLFNEALTFYGGDETEWHHRLLKEGGRMMYLPKAYVMHRRTATDVAPAAMLRRRYRMGKAWPMVAPHLDRQASVAGGLGVAFSGLAHALTRWCWVGVLRAAYGAGHALSAASLLLAGEGRRKDVTWLPRRG